MVTTKLTELINQFLINKNTPANYTLGVDFTIILIQEGFEPKYMFVDDEIHVFIGNQVLSNDVDFLLNENDIDFDKLNKYKEQFDRFIELIGHKYDLLYGIAKKLNKLEKPLNNVIIGYLRDKNIPKTYSLGIDMSIILIQEGFEPKYITRRNTTFVMFDDIILSNLESNQILTSDDVDYEKLTEHYTVFDNFMKTIGVDIGLNNIVKHYATDYSSLKLIEIDDYNQMNDMGIDNWFITNEKFIIAIDENEAIKLHTSYQSVYKELLTEFDKNVQLKVLNSHTLTECELREIGYKTGLIELQDTIDLVKEYIYDLLDAPKHVKKLIKKRYLTTDEIHIIDDYIKIPF